MAFSDYTTLASAKLYAGISGTDDDAAIKALIPVVSREIDALTHRFFYELSATRYYDFQDAWRLILDRDLLTITTFTNGDDEVLVQGTDFYRYPLNGPPFRRLYIRQDVGKLFQWSATTQKAISIAAKWGYSTDYDNAWLDSGDTVQDAVSVTAAATSVTVIDADAFATRQTIKIGDEQMLVTDRNTTTEVLTVTRGINGTDAAIHLNGAKIYIWVVEGPIVRAANGWVVFLLNYADKIGLSRIKMGDFESALGFFLSRDIALEPPYDVALIIKEYRYREYWNRY